MSERDIIVSVATFVLVVAFVIGAGLIFKMMRQHKVEAHYETKEKKGKKE
ncbi:hypothetical protein [Candidatus Oleimmundimicrobium sp.]|nr:hypothetical protein [Candidatus Oleimmundimicrobium sp.]MDO8886640.1 hypothetical protein [Candidatus Oleimmundimicrobium sp.]